MKLSCSTILVLTAALSGAPSFAQQTPPGRPGSLGFGLGAGGPGDRSGSITSTGQTKPPGAALGPKDGTNEQLDQKSRQLDRKIQTGICSGCD